MTAPPLRSALYRGTVRHRRRGPGPEHAFSYPIAYLYLDLAELDRVFEGRWLWSARRPAPARFRAADHLADERTGPGAADLDRAVRDLVERASGRRPAGPVCVLTFPRILGFVFNPVSFFYCFGEGADGVEAVVAEVSNTPWNERHLYVLHGGIDRGRGGEHRYRFAKAFHVSPFLPMDLGYDWRFTEPGATIAVHMDVQQRGRTIFEATLDLERREATGANLAAALRAHPLLPWRAVAAIYWQALRLRVKGAPFFEHPAAATAGGGRT